MRVGICQPGDIVVINNTPLRNCTGKVIGLKEGCGETGVIAERYEHEGRTFYAIDMGNGLELHFTYEHFDVVK